ncbi:MAG TPA: tetraacyldisaccharide 4'-kinase, partial [Pyrinomonadaceae bacterium]
MLPPLSAVYAAVARARLAAYRRGWLSVAKLAAPVISVGNLTTGGTGKTPLVEWVCRVLAGESVPGIVVAEPPKKVCVLTRGYGRANPKSQVVVSNGTEILVDERDSGDEPMLLARNLLGTAAVIANPNRVAAGEWALKNLGSEAFVLDDGFQHLRLARDLDIVTIDATNPFGGSRLLPAGRLREPISGLA